VLQKHFSVETKTDIPMLSVSNRRYGIKKIVIFSWVSQYYYAYGIINCGKLCQYNLSSDLWQWWHLLCKFYNELLPYSYNTVLSVTMHIKQQPKFIQTFNSHMSA